ncbi:MAG: right-handed parallel beta-helix repeat-containing protein [Planctomycetota bacterium]|nr:right-handed parallel beta-helix repeat-containing protein [Planctomycetota bacterium]
MRIIFKIPTAFLLATTTTVQSIASVDLHVSPNGNNANAGTETSPYATLDRARDEIRALRSAQGNAIGPVRVWIHPGVYVLNQTLAFTEQDSGTEDAPVSYRSFGDESPILTGGAVLKPLKKDSNRDLLDRLSAPARANVVFYTTEHSAEGMSVELQRRALGQSMLPAPMELFSGASVLPRAGWPNGDWAVAKPHVSKKHTLSLNRKIDSRDVNHCWAHGFWFHDWSDSFEKVSYTSAGLNKTEVTIHIETSDLAIRDGSRFRLENLLTELDAPGEWFIDSQTGRMAVWRLSSDDDRLVVSSLETALSVYEAEYVHFEGLTVEGTRAMGIEIVGGRNVKLDDCTIRYSGNVGVNVYHGHKHSIADCEVHGTGSSGIRIEGGDRATLDSAGHTCVENEIHDCCYSYCAQRPAIAVFGVGIQIQSNHIYNQPDAAIALHGNEHRVKSNRIHHVCRLADDAGAITIAHDPTFRGNQISQNHIFDIGGFGQRDIVGIYLDDFASGTTVEGNLLERTIRGIVVGGGRDNILERNTIVDCIAGIQVDCRGQSWAKHLFHGESPEFHKYCLAISHDKEIYAERYPGLASLLDDEPQIAKGNTIRANTIRCPIAIDLQDGLSHTVVRLENNQTETSPVFVNLKSNDSLLSKSDQANKEANDRTRPASIP